ncbi:hypothetical protein [Halorubrum halodurans]|nr:hypothetical protein [Halorubrum halodurans]
MSSKHADRNGDDKDEPPTLLERLRMTKIVVKIVVMVQQLLG